MKRLIPIFLVIVLLIVSTGSALAAPASGPPTPKKPAKMVDAISQKALQAPAAVAKDVKQLEADLKTGAGWVTKGAEYLLGKPPKVKPAPITGPNNWTWKERAIPYTPSLTPKPTTSTKKK